MDKHKKQLGENHEVERLVEEFEKQGVKIRVVNPQDVDIFVDRDDRKSISLRVNQENYLTLYYQELVVERLTLLKLLSDT